MNSAKTPPSDDGLSIRVVARLTGINPDTLRVWERRYQLTTPARAGARRTRRYSEEDVRRLTAVKALVDAGHPVSSVARLGIDQLESRLRDDTFARRIPRLERTSPLRVVLAGPATALALQGSAGGGMQIEASLPDVEAFEGRLPGLAGDVAVVELPSVQADTPQRVRRWRAAGGISHFVLVYGFAARLTLGQLEAQGVVCLPQPIEGAALRRACEQAAGAVTAVADLGNEVREGVPGRRFSAEQLTRIAGAVPTIACECPRHLVSLVNSLMAFETYSSECAGRNDSDRDMHRVLQVATAQARARLESALAVLVEFEGISIE